MVSASLLPEARFPASLATWGAEGDEKNFPAMWVCRRLGKLVEEGPLSRQSLDHPLSLLDWRGETYALQYKQRTANRDDGSDTLPGLCPIIPGAEDAEIIVQRFPRIMGGSS